MGSYKWDALSRVIVSLMRRLTLDKNHALSATLLGPHKMPRLFGES